MLEATNAKYLSAARRAATAFGLEPEQIDIISHSENVVCDLTLGGDKHAVMRLHRPGYNTLNELESEVQWVAALGDTGLPVPTAVPTTNGNFYTSVDVDNHEIHVGVVEWVPGKPLGGPTNAGGPEIIGHYRRIGELMAKIRRHDDQWTRPDSFTRRRWDAEGLVGDGPLWGRFWEVETLTGLQRDLFTETRSVLADKLSSLPTTSEFFGLIHADLHLGNLMANGDQLTIIDFDDAGFGWFAHEIAVSLHPVLDGREVPIYTAFDEIAAQTQAACTRYLS